MPVNSIESLKARFAQLSSDGKIDARDVEALISLVKDGGGVTNSERRQLRELFYAHTDAFDAPANARITKFINNEIPALLIDDPVVSSTGGQRDLADPPVQKDDVNTLKYDWVTGQLYVDGVSKDDVVQGMIGNCYMMAGISAVAAQHPDAIQNAIKDNGDGTYTVRFYKGQGYTAQSAFVTVTVDSELPTRWGGLQYGKGKNRRELWVPLLEKAFAQWKGGYENIGHGGSAGAVMTALTGQPNRATFVSTSSDGKKIYDQIRLALQSGHCAAAGTHAEKDKAMYAGTGLYTDHAYSIVGTSEANGVRYVHLRNPWGEVEPAGNGVDDGNFRLPMDKFLKLYNSLYIA